ncbi:heavy metal-binding domain-containing protein [Atopobacter phocae]|uniref:heavy metal-binding domain-containing protein n=1 Tax=Atopobacter phocae TaxID=136492 RepID=UPI00046EFB45|nr:heavy metal-binding domain-containing protein [Atopobacter phocae]
MIITTTQMIQNKEILEYKGIVFGEVITGINIFKDFAAGIRNVLGGRSKGYENELIGAREKAIEELEKRALNMDADAVVGLKFDYEVLGADNGMLLITCSGTAVKLK